MTTREANPTRRSSGREKAAPLSLDVGFTARNMMYNTNAPRFPDISTDEYFMYTAKQVDGFVGLQIRNGPYGAISSDKLSDGTIHFCCDKDMAPEQFLEVAEWVARNGTEILNAALASLVDQYWEMRDDVIDCLIDEDPDDVVPEIDGPDDLRRLCGIVAVHVKPYGGCKAPRFGIEFGCTWEDEHGAGVRFEALKVLQSGHASDAFDY